VWPHHVGVIRGGPNSSGEYLVESGNDGHAVRTRYRSLSGVIAFRYVGGESGLAFQKRNYAPQRAQQQRYARRADEQNFGWAGYNAVSMDERSGYLRVAQNWPSRDRRLAGSFGSINLSIFEVSWRINAAAAARQFGPAVF
jgi:hypothetical protein